MSLDDDEIWTSVVFAADIIESLAKETEFCTSRVLTWVDMQLKTGPNTGKLAKASALEAFARNVGNDDTIILESVVTNCCSSSIDELPFCRKAVRFEFCTRR